MEKLLLITVIAFASMAAAPATSTRTASASDQAGASAPQRLNDGGTTTATGAAVEEKKICKALPTSGTRLTKTACLTAKEWTKLQAELDNGDDY